MTSTREVASHPRVRREAGPRRRAGTPDAAAPAREGGYTLVILAVTTAVVGILLTATLPTWETAVQREKEAELHFRGMQYAEAIRVYQNRFQSLPTKLEQLIERKPRSIRQLWKDPMTEDGEWEVIHATAGGRRGRQPPGRGQSDRERDGEEEEPEEEQRDRDGRRPGTRDGEGQRVGPIIGVRSRSEEESLMIFDGEDTYDAWEFVVELVPAPQTRPETGIVTRANSEWVGRGFPEGIEPEQGLGKRNPTDSTRPGSGRNPADRRNNPRGRGSSPRR